MWKIIQIFDGEYGCEELVPGSKPKVSVTLENENHEQKYISVEDEWLIENQLDEGSIWPEEMHMDLSNITVNEQSSIRISGDKVLYFDPFNISDEKHDADIIFITHEHFDHFQPESINKIKKADTIIIAPASMEKQIKEEAGVANYNLLEPGTTFECGGVAIETIPAYNVFPKPFHIKSKKWQGYLVQMNEIKYYVAGDTDVNEDIKKVRCDVALVPIGGKFTMDKRQAADFIECIKPKAAIPTHYGDIVGKKADGIEFKNYVEKLDESILVEVLL